MKKKRRIDRRRYPNRKNLSNRNVDDPAYKKWREEVFTRDNHTCQFPNCSCIRHLNAHHILRWADYPSLRFEVSNGISLCATHHKMIKGKEDQYAQLFLKILSLKLVQKLNSKIHKNDENKTDKNKD